jgi:hypothetical protein
MHTPIQKSRLCLLFSTSLLLILSKMRLPGLLQHEATNRSQNFVTLQQSGYVRCAGMLGCESMQRVQRSCPDGCILLLTLIAQHSNFHILQRGGFTPLVQFRFYSAAIIESEAALIVFNMIVAHHVGVVSVVKQCG